MTTSSSYLLDPAKKDWHIIRGRNPYASFQERLPIHFAIYEDYPTFEAWDNAIVHAIESHPRHINAQDNKGDTAMHRLLYSGSKRAMQTLLQAGINLHIKNHLGVDVLEEMLNIKDDRAHEDMEEIFEAEILRRKTVAHARDAL
jgi:ankyrin repeat protein